MPKVLPTKSLSPPPCDPLLWGLIHVGGISQTAISHHLGVSVSLVSHYTRGRGVTDDQRLVLEELTRQALADLKGFEARSSTLRNYNRARIEFLEDALRGERI